MKRILCTTSGCRTRSARNSTPSSDCATSTAVTRLRGLAGGALVAVLTSACAPLQLVPDTQDALAVSAA
ncbi:MAG: hypothetical protein KDK91_29995, partial [Gammaproteobacteria bacterium]|nr:hypothetical protein [Gammaproteobacteria bacterium]